MTQAKTKTEEEAEGWPKELPAEPFPEISLARLPVELRDALRSLWLVVAGSARYFAARGRSRKEIGALRVELEALGRDLDTLAGIATGSAARSEAETTALRAVAFEVADRLRELAHALRVRLEGTT